MYLHKYINTIQNMYTNIQMLKGCQKHVKSIQKQYDLPSYFRVKIPIFKNVDEKCIVK